MSPACCQSLQNAFFGSGAATENRDLQVAETIRLTFKEVSGYEFVQVFASTIADRCAKGVADKLDHEEEVCAMHDGDKLGQSAAGALCRTKNKVNVTPPHHIHHTTPHHTSPHRTAMPYPVRPLRRGLVFC